MSNIIIEFLKWIFQSPTVEIKEGMQESCFVNVFRMFYDFPSLPTLDCSVIQGRDSVGYLNTIVNGTVIEDPVSTVIQNPITLDPTLLSSTFVMLFAVSLLGITLCELCYNKLDYLLSPIIDRVTKRYYYTVERNRLGTMNGHP